ncbi:hypothetical protein MSAN_02201200 [Mycena sanguinolenta]|uniref:Uncharacterized protein n=1 Tax=Mycena sanguinolenta TaxID=230812 RepID=A0A8H7CJZ9_9AGAR|nr:hypothetical protein MSAN_02201200 [Mycena sanguinolenta]
MPSLTAALCFSPPAPAANTLYYRILVQHSSHCYLSHVPIYWRAFVFSDKGRAERFSAIVSYSNEIPDQCLTRFNILDKVTRRCIASRLFVKKLNSAIMIFISRTSSASVRHVSKLTTSLSSMRRAPALAKYDLRERDLQFTRLLTPEWINPKRTSKRPPKLICESCVKEICAFSFSFSFT